MSSAISDKLKATFYGLARLNHSRGAGCCAHADTFGPLLSSSCVEHHQGITDQTRTSSIRGDLPPARLSSPVGLGPLLTRRMHQLRGVAAPRSCPALQLRHLSWRRFVPSMSGLRNAAEAPDRQVVNLLLAINCATYMLSWLDRGVAVNMALIPYQVARGEWYRLLTCGFLHLDLLHLLVRMTPYATVLGGRSRCGGGVRLGGAGQQD
jgi:hypothetical protein